MFRTIVLASLTASSLVWIGCSNSDTTMKGPVVIGDDMATDGTGGNGGSGGSGGGGGGASADMSHASMDMGPALPDLSGLPPADHDPTQHPAPPRLGALQGPLNHNSSIPTPEIWTAVWEDDAATIGADVNKFTTWMLASDYWKTGVAEYGVQAGTSKGVIKIPGTHPTTIDQAGLDALIDANMGKGGWPTANANTIISIVTNPATTVTAGGQPAGCVQFGGYHSISSQGGVPYLVNVYCNDAAGKPDFNNLTVTISHEAAEAATDWNLSVNRAYYPGTTTLLAGGGETGDICLAMNATVKTAAGDTYSVQKIFSDANAAAGNKWWCPDPTLPNDPYWGAGLYSGGTNDAAITISRTGGKGSATIKIEPFSYDPNFGPMSFYVVGSFLGTGVTLSPDIARRADPAHPGQVLGMRAYGVPGSTTMVTVNVDSTFPAASVGKPLPILIIAQTPDRAKLSIWWGSLTVKK